LVSVPVSAATIMVSPETVLMVPRMGGVFRGTAGVWAVASAAKSRARQMACTMILFWHIPNLSIKHSLSSLAFCERVRPPGRALQARLLIRRCEVGIAFQAVGAVFLVQSTYDLQL